MFPVNEWEVIFAGGKAGSLPKNGEWRVAPPVFGGFGRTRCGFSGKNRPCGLVRGLHVVQVFEIKSLA